MTKLQNISDPYNLISISGRSCHALRRRTVLQKRRENQIACGHPTL